jgi:hypothetical protein
MKYESEHGVVKFWDPWPQLNVFKKIGINLSGGCDSALLMFFTCRELERRNSDATIIPITGVHTLRPTNIWNATEILSLFKDMFPTVNFGEHQVFYYDKESSDDKVNKHHAYERTLYRDKIIDALFHGRTSNPPKEECEKHDLSYNRELKRDCDSPKKETYLGDHRGGFYCPFDYVDKRFIADMYKQYNLMDNLFPLTASCVGYADTTDYWTKPCKECWWCREKKWAFGYYDGKITD